MSKEPKYRGYENPEAHRANVERTQSGAAGQHQDRRERRARTRKAAEQRDIRDQEK